jgi:hypothetical protein
MKQLVMCNTPVTLSAGIADSEACGEQQRRNASLVRPN